MLFPGEETLENGPKYEDCTEHQNLFPGVKLQRHQQRTGQFEAEAKHCSLSHKQPGVCHTSTPHEGNQGDQHVTDDHDSTDQVNNQHPDMKL